MSRILIVSDSHGDADMLRAIEEKHGQDVDLMIHCGDSELSEKDEAIANFHSVKGNCDFYGDFPEDQLHEVGGRKIFVTHGHLYSVKSTLVHLFYKAKELQADIVCFGHSHILGAEKVEEILFINPGSVRLPRGRKERTYVILDLNGLNARAEIYDYGHGELADLRQEFSLHKNE